MFAATLQDIGNEASLADADVWLWPAVKHDGSHYYEYIFVYVDDLLVLSTCPEQTMMTLEKFYRLKEGSVEKPTKYLGAQILEHHLPENPGKWLWSMSADKYLKEALHNVETKLLRDNLRLPTKISTNTIRTHSPLAS